MPPCKAGVYAVRNVANGKVYVGQTQHLSRRWTSHRADLRQNKHVNTHLQRAWNKYGPTSFVFEVLHLLKEGEDLALLEMHYIELLGALQPARGYNLNAVTPVSYRASEETRQKQSAAQRAYHAANPNKKRTPEQIERMRLAHLGAVASPETRLKMSASHKGKPKSEAHRNNIGAAGRGRVVAPETRKKIGAAHKGRTASLETRAKMSVARLGKKRGPYLCRTTKQEGPDGPHEEGTCPQMQ